MDQTKKTSYHLQLIGVMGILLMFTMASVVLLTISERAYDTTRNDNAGEDQVRTVLSYVAEKVRRMDKEGQIHIERNDGIDSLVLIQNIRGEEYEARMYAYKGVLYESFQKKGRELSLPDTKQKAKIAEVSSFTMTELTDTLLQFTAIVDGQKESLTVMIRARR